MFIFVIQIIAILLILTGCATTQSSPLGEKSMQDRFGNAIASPLNDLNIVQTSIPVVVQDAVKNPYDIPTDVSCKALAEQVHALDAALGVDLDVHHFDKAKTNAEKSQEFIENEAIGSVERTINGFVPFRGWIRKITGAERHSKEVAAAISAGVIRRAFLKGIGLAHGCEPPAAPFKAPPAAPLSPPTTIVAPNDKEMPVSPTTTQASATATAAAP